MSKAKAIALIAYTADDDDELSFKQNDLIDIKSTKGGHWWFGTLNGRSGCVPKKYLELQVLDKYKAVKPYQSSKKEHLRLEENDIIEVLIKEVDEWFGRINNTEGWFPPECVELYTQQHAPKPLPSLGPKAQPQPNVRNTFDEISKNASPLTDLRKERPKKPAVRKPDHRLSLEEEEEDDSMPNYDIPSIPSREIKPRPIEKPQMLYVDDLKSKFKRLNSTKDETVSNTKTNLTQMSSKSIPNLTSLDEEDRINNPSRFFGPKPFTSKASGSSVTDVKSDKELEKRVGILEKMVGTMMEQLNGIKKEMARIKMGN